MTINDEARKSVIAAMFRERSQSKIAKYYEVPQHVIYEYLHTQHDLGTVYARKILRVEIARRHAERMGRPFTPDQKDRYKGTRTR